VFLFYNFPNRGKIKNVKIVKITFTSMYSWTDTLLHILTHLIHTKVAAISAKFFSLKLCNWRTLYMVCVA